MFISRSRPLDFAQQSFFLLSHEKLGLSEFSFFFSSERKLLYKIFSSWIALIFPRGEKVHENWIDNATPITSTTFPIVFRFCLPSEKLLAKAQEKVWKCQKKI